MSQTAVSVSHRLALHSRTVHWRAVLLAVVTIVVWVDHYDRWTLASWSVPTDYRGDSLEIFARIQAAAEGNTVPLRPQVISRLGAPFGANWSAYPTSDLPLVCALGWLARSVGVFAAANLALLLATVSAALAFYGCARWLRTRWEWAFAGALLFAFTFQTFSRGLPHLFLVFAWTVPPALLACGFVATSRRLHLRGGRGIFCVSIAAVIGASNPYTLFLFLQLLAWALVAQWLGARRRENLRVGLAALATAVFAFFVVESHVWLFTPDTAAPSPIVRGYLATELYALKPMELFLPPAGHRWDALAFFGHRYVRWSEWRNGEPFTPYLGLVGIVGFAWLALITLRAILRRRRLPGLALPAGWVLAFASVGGLTNVMAFFTGLIVFRATNRFSIFVSAVVLLFLAAQMSRWWRERRLRRTWALSPAWWQSGSILAAALVVVVGLVDQLPRAPGLAQQERIARRLAADRELGSLLEGRLPKGAMVFQLPVMMFPEVGSRGQLGDYEHFRPFLATKSLRFNYGALKRRSRGRWQREVEELPTVELVRRIEHYGFAALYLNRRGFADRGEKLLAELRALGRTKFIEGALGEQVVVLLEPNLTPKLPLARTLTFGHGWHSARAGEPRWAYGPGAFSYYNPTSLPRPATARFSVSAAGPRTVNVVFNAGEKKTVPIGEARQEISLQVTLRPGFNRFDLDSVEPAQRLTQERGHLRSFAVHATAVTFDDHVATSER
jgi:phosphoglycerol transferase